MARFRGFSAILGTLGILALVISACSPGSVSVSDPKVQMVPDPTTFPTPYFTDFDAAYAEVPFTRGFTFTFFGTAYTSIYINTNGGVTFGGGISFWAPRSTDITEPGIGILWADLDASNTDPANHDGLDYQQFDDRFVISYYQYGDSNTSSLHNTMTLSLYADGKITMHYDAQETIDYVLLGVFDGSGAYNGPVSLQSTYNNYSANHGFYVFNGNDTGGTNPTSGQLDGMTLTFNP